MKVGMRTPSLKKSVKAQTTGKVKRAVKKSVSPGYGQKGVGWIKDPKKAAYNKVYNKTTFGVGDVYRGIGGNGSRSSSNSSFSGSAAEIPEVRIPSKLEKVLTSSEKKKYISLVQTGCVLDQDRDSIIKANGKRTKISTFSLCRVIAMIMSVVLLAFGLAGLSTSVGIGAFFIIFGALFFLMARSFKTTITLHKKIFQIKDDGFIS